MRYCVPLFFIVLRSLAVAAEPLAMHADSGFFVYGGPSLGWQIGVAVLLVLFGVMAAAFVVMLRRSRQIRDDLRNLTAVLSRMPMELGVADKRGRLFMVQTQELRRWDFGTERVTVRGLSAELADVLEEPSHIVLSSHAPMTIEHTLRGRHCRTHVYLLPSSCYGRDTYVWFTFDIEEVVAAQNQLTRALIGARMADKNQGNFLDTLNRELQKPLQQILELSLPERDAELAVESAVMPERLGAIHKESRALALLLEDFIELASLNSGHISMHLEKVSLIYLCREMEALFCEVALAKGIELRINCQEEIPMLKMDGHHLRDILRRLLAFALQQTREGVVQLGVEYAEMAHGKGMLVVQVGDSSEGLTGACLQRVFEPFELLSEQGGGQPCHAGLGLAIAKRWTERLDGTLMISRVRERGNLFTVTLPHLEVAEITTLEPITDFVMPESLPKRTALLVDDAQINLTVLRLTLEKYNCTSLLAHTADEVFELLREHHPDLILTDIWLAETTGVELAARIRELPGFGSIPIVAVTADTEVRANFDLKDFNAVIIKPFSIEQLLEVLAACPVRRM